MVVDQKTIDALNLDRLDLPAQPKVVSIEVLPHVNAEGEDSLRVWVILAKETDEEKLNGSDVLQIKSSILESLQSNGIDYFPYVFLAKEGEREAYVDDED